MTEIEYSKLVSVATFGQSRKPPEIWRIKFGPKERKATKARLNELRSTHYPDKGFSYDLTEVKLLSEGAQKLLLYCADDVSTENRIGMDIYIAHKPSEDVKILVQAINKIIITTGTKSIRIRRDRYNGLMRRWQWGLLAFGAANVIGGFWLGVKPMKAGGVNFESNMIQVMGYIFIGIAGMPIVIQQLINLIKAKANAKNQDVTS